MYLRDCQTESVKRAACPIGGRFARRVRRSPEFKSRTVLLPERFRVDCAFGGQLAALSHSRRNYTALKTFPARWSRSSKHARALAPGICDLPGKRLMAARLGISGGACRGQRRWTAVKQRGECYTGVVAACGQDSASEVASSTDACRWRRQRVVPVSIFFTPQRIWPLPKILLGWFDERLFFRHVFCLLNHKSVFVESVGEFRRSS